MDEQTLLASGIFDPVWYCSHHRLKALIGAGNPDAARHFLSHGLKLGLDPSPDTDLRFHADLFGVGKHAAPFQFLDQLVRFSACLASGGEPAFDHSRLPWALNRLYRRGRGDLALRLADRLLPPSLAGFRHLLHANLALAAGDAEGWLSALNTYLSRHGVNPIGLSALCPGRLDALHAEPSATIAEGPLVTVIIPAWQAEATIAASLTSVLSQGWRQLEVIAIDDASTDGTPEILNRMARQDPRVRVLRNPVNVGPYVGRNIALGHARGAWVCCHDADEWAHPDRLFLQMAWLRRAGRPAVSQIGMLRMQADGVFSQIGRAGDHTVDGALRPCPSNTTFDAAFLRQRLGSWDCARLGADSEMIARATMLCGSAPPLLASPLVLSLDHPDSLTNRADTGTGGGSALSAARAAYRKYWTARLAPLRGDMNDARLFRAFPPGGPTELPPEVAVPAEDIGQCLHASEGLASLPRTDGAAGAGTQ